MHAPPAHRRAALPDVRRHRAYRTLMAWGKRQRLRGGRVSLYEIGERVLLHELRLDSLEKRAAYMAFNLTLALFPTIIFLFTLIPYIPVPNLDVDILQFLADIMPRELYAATASTIEDIVRIPHGGLLSFGFGSALVLSSNGIMALLDAFEKKYPWFKHRGYFHKRLIATGLTFVLALVLVVSIAGIFFGTFIIDALVFYEIVPESSTELLIMLLRYGSLVGLFFKHHVHYLLLRAAGARQVAICVNGGAGGYAAHLFGVVPLHALRPHFRFLQPLLRLHWSAGGFYGMVGVCVHDAHHRLRGEREHRRRHRPAGSGSEQQVTGN